jgi:hypothetical protein
VCEAGRARVGKRTSDDAENARRAFLIRGETLLHNSRRRRDKIAKSASYYKAD